MLGNDIDPTAPVTTPLDITVISESHRDGYRVGYKDGLADALRGQQYAETWYEDDPENRELAALLFVVACALVLLGLWYAISNPFVPEVSK